MHSEAGLTRERAQALRAGEFMLLLVEPAMVLKLREGAEHLATFRTAVPPYLRMGPPMIFQSEQVGVGLEAHGAGIDANGVCVFVVQQRTSMTV